MNRRSLLRAAGGAMAVAGFGSAAGNFRRPLGVQLYTVRNVLKDKEDETLRRIAEIGYTEVEMAGGSMQTFGPILARYKLKAVSSHLDALSVSAEPPRRYNGPPFEQTIAAAKRDGIEYLVFPYLQPDQRGGLDVYRRLAEKLNRAGEQVRAAGLTFCYHNHAFEFAGAMGQRPIDVLKTDLDKTLVNFEIDVFWVSVAGNDPVAILKEFAGRAPLIHLKDKAAGTPVQFDELKVSKETFKEVGSGVLDFPAILRTAEAAGVKRYFVEQDQTPGDPVDSLRQSYEFLRNVKL
jgi:sugar phosphate isomerase/epimerase